MYKAKGTQGTEQLCGPLVIEADEETRLQFAGEYKETSLSVYSKRSSSKNHWVVLEKICAVVWLSHHRYKKFLQLWTEIHFVTLQKLIKVTPRARRKTLYMDTEAAAGPTRLDAADIYLF